MIAGYSFGILLREWLISIWVALQTSRMSGRWDEEDWSMQLAATGATEKSMRDLAMGVDEQVCPHCLCFIPIFSLVKHVSIAQLFA